MVLRNWLNYEILYEMNPKLFCQPREREVAVFLRLAKANAKAYASPTT